MQKNSTILKQRVALGNPTFPVSPREFRVLVECLVAILACSLPLGPHVVHQDTFLKICPLQVNHRQQSLEIREIWHQLLADLYL